VFGCLELGLITRADKLGARFIVLSYRIPKKSRKTVSMYVGRQLLFFDHQQRN
jgi:hypothetical protein